MVILNRMEEHSWPLSVLQSRLFWRRTRYELCQGECSRSAVRKAWGPSKLRYFSELDLGVSLQRLNQSPIRSVRRQPETYLTKGSWTQGLRVYFLEKYAHHLQMFKLNRVQCHSPSAGVFLQNCPVLPREDELNVYFVSVGLAARVPWAFVLTYSAQADLYKVLYISCLILAKLSQRLSYQFLLPACCLIRLMIVGWGSIGKKIS